MLRSGLAVADGTRGVGGAAASRAAIDALEALELTDAPAAELIARLAAAVGDIDRSVRAGGTEAATTLIVFAKILIALLKK